ncbi:MAG: hypothetical protein AAGK97_10805, partial [Bacteroidota bacterium]
FVPSSNAAVPRNGNGFLYDHYLYVPLEYDSTRSIPLVVDLHGTGGSGIVGHIRQVQEGRRASFIVLSPNSGTLNGFYNVHALDSLIGQAITKFNVDTNKIYITGISRGALAAVNYAYNRPSKIAAMILFAGELPMIDNFNIERIKHIPVWIVNGEHDFHEGYAMHELWNEQTNSYSRFNWIFNQQHDENSFVEYYSNSKLDTWLNAQDKSLGPQYELELRRKDLSYISLGFYHQGDTVFVNAPPPDAGRTFLYWEKNNLGQLGDDEMQSTQFVMPASDVRLLPNYSNINCFLKVNHGKESGGLNVNGYKTITADRLANKTFVGWEVNPPIAIQNPGQLSLSPFDAESIYVKDTCIPLEFTAIYDDLEPPLIRDGNIISANFIPEDYFGKQALPLFEGDLAGAYQTNWWNNIAMNDTGGYYNDLINNSNIKTEMEVEISTSNDNRGYKIARDRNSGMDRLMLFSSQFYGPIDQERQSITLTGRNVPYGKYQLLIYFRDESNRLDCSGTATLNGNSIAFQTPQHDENFYSANWFKMNEDGIGNTILFKGIDRDSFQVTFELEYPEDATRFS